MQTFPPNYLFIYMIITHCLLCLDSLHIQFDMLLQVCMGKNITLFLFIQLFKFNVTKSQRISLPLHLMCASSVPLPLLLMYM